MIHELKTWPEHFHNIFMGRKTFEVRKNDRNFQVGDMLILQKFNPDTQQYEGKEMARKVTSILHGGQFGIKEVYCVMSIQ